MMFTDRIKTISFTIAMILLVGCWNDSEDPSIDIEGEQICGDLTEMAQRSYALSEDEKAAWHKSNLYDSTTESYYLPPELFYATAWDGRKRLDEPDVDYFRGQRFCNRVIGPESWSHPETGKTYSIYRSVRSFNTDYLQVGEQGFELVFQTSANTYYQGAIFIPSGAHWRIQEPRSSEFISWNNGVQSELTQTIEIEEILFDSEDVLAWIVFRRSVDGKLVVEHMLEPRRGITRTYEYDQDSFDGGSEGYDCGEKSAMAELSYALSDQEEVAWARANLFDSSTESYFIPPALWTGAVWDGDKALTAHAADLYFGDYFCKHIAGPTNWTHPFNNEDYQVYTRTSTSTLQYFANTPKGLGRVYDNRRDGVYFEGEVKFPAGAGWQVGDRVSLPYRRWSDGVVKDRIRKIEITRILFDENDVLAAMSYRFYAGDEGDILDHEYTYMPRRGMAYLYKFAE